MSWAGESIHNAILSEITSAPIRKRITKIMFVYDDSGNLVEIRYFQEDTFLFKLLLSYDSEGRLSEVTRVE